MDFIKNAVGGQGQGNNQQQQGGSNQQQGGQSSGGGGFLGGIGTLSLAHHTSYPRKN